MITVGFSTHRVETLAAAEQLMATHPTVALEEPPTEGFQAMLVGELSVEAHLEQVAPEFPEYSRHQCAVLRRLHRSGVRVVQVDPFLAELEAIHDLFEHGGDPADITPGTVRGQVYQAERHWTGALLGYYAASHSADFERVVDSVCAFARADAERGRLRDAMRADTLLELVEEHGTLYAETGTLHTELVRQLRRHAPAGVSIRPRWLMAPVVRRLYGRAPLIPPGDLLTIASTGNGRRSQTQKRLLAARSLIQVAISLKEETVPTDAAPYPHVQDDIETYRLVDGLSYIDCRELYPRVRSRPWREARHEVLEFHETPVSR